MKLAGNVAVVTGAASGMGRALCEALGREGVVLGLLDRAEPGLDSLTAELKAAGVRCASAVADVTDRAGVTAAIQTLADQLGPIELLVACAGITDVTLVDDLAVAKTEAILRVNVLGVAYCINAVLPGMLARGSGQIVGICSLAGMRGVPYTAGYSASKAGMALYLESLRPPLRKRGISVTTVYPGFVRTPLMENSPVQPPTGMMTPARAARHILRAIRGRYRVYSFPWTSRFMITFSSWLCPWLYDRLMCAVAKQFPNLRY